MVQIGTEAALFHGDAGAAYATVGPRTYPVRSTVFRQYLINTYLKRCAGKVPNGEALAAALGAIDLVAANPFADVAARSVPPADRRHHISPDDAGRVLAACDPAWRLIVALSRFAGLRCPSEVLSLTWANVDLPGGRVTVSSPKTERIPEKAYRVVPVFAALRPYRDEGFDPAGAVYGVPGTRRAAVQGPNVAGRLRPGRGGRTGAAKGTASARRNPPSAAGPNRPEPSRRADALEIQDSRRLVTAKTGQDGTARWVYHDPTYPKAAV